MRSIVNVLNYIFGCLLLFASYVIETRSFEFRHSYVYSFLFGALGLVLLLVGVAFNMIRQLTTEERDWLRKCIHSRSGSL